MTVNSLQKTVETGAAEGPLAPRGRFRKGQSGNPAGRPRGAKNRATLAAELLLEGEAEALMRKVVELALGGDTAALRLCLDRLVAPRRDRPVRFVLPPIRSAADLAEVMKAVARAAAEGAITPAEAFDLARVVDTLIRAVGAGEAEARQRCLEEAWHSAG